jgi:hypothetical protein
LQENVLYEKLAAQNAGACVARARAFALLEDLCCACAYTSCARICCHGNNWSCSTNPNTFPVCRLIAMGCAGSTPAPEEATQLANPQKVDSAEMAAVKAKLAEAKAKAEAEGGEKEGNVAFERKFKGFKAGGGGKHDVKRAKDMSPEAVAERERINAAIQKKKEEREAKLAAMNPIKRQLSRAASNASSTSSLIRALTRGRSAGGSSSGGSSSFLRSLTRSMSRSFTKRSGRSPSGRIPAEELNAPSGLHDHGHEDAAEESRKSAKGEGSTSQKKVGFAAPPPKPDLDA